METAREMLERLRAQTATLAQEKQKLEQRLRTEESTGDLLIDYLVLAFGPDFTSEQERKHRALDAELAAHAGELFLLVRYGRSASYRHEETDPGSPDALHVGRIAAQRRFDKGAVLTDRFVEGRRHHPGLGDSVQLTSWMQTRSGTLAFDPTDEKGDLTLVIGDARVKGWFHQRTPPHWTPYRGPGLTDYLLLLDGGGKETAPHAA